MCQRNNHKRPAWHARDGKCFVVCNTHAFHSAAHDARRGASLSLPTYTVSRGRARTARITPYIAAATHICTQSQTMHEQLAFVTPHPRNRPAQPPPTTSSLLGGMRATYGGNRPPFAASCDDHSAEICAERRRVCLTSERSPRISPAILPPHLPSAAVGSRSVLSTLLLSLLPALSRPLSGRACARSPHDLRSRRRRGTPR